MPKVTQCRPLEGDWPYLWIADSGDGGQSFHLKAELVDLGCDVTLFASGDSCTSAALVPACARALRHKDIDLIHCHIDWIHIPMLRRVEVPFVTTIHGRLDLPSLSLVARSFKHAPLISISDSQRVPLSEFNWIGTVYHGLPPDLLSPQTRPTSSYLAFLGRISPEKGPDVAIRIARTVGLPLRIAAKIPRSETRYFKERIRPLLDGSRVEFVGEVDDAAKADFLGNAAALLFPIDWPEPFGLVVIEAMACGTPVIAWRRGSVPEIIDHGVTGYIVENETEAVQAVGALDRLDRRNIRRVFEQRFTAKRMAQEYMHCFERLGCQR
jgi:glycosyltransferase involved in cell wall biosynthesis